MVKTISVAVIDIMPLPRLPAGYNSCQDMAKTTSMAGDNYQDMAKKKTKKN